ncbi:MAG: manganese efflux pump MntP family protein [Oscillospiraceae bacterium]|jgi:putative Mn2+ efflux pump MntP|nr:manganese efflux pump MntP family protein [Oscillospiraceae bacterium]
MIAVGLSADAFSVAICKGLALRKINLKQLVTVGLYFGLSQAIMPLIGFLVASRFADLIVSVDHWIAFILLSVIGGKMLWEALHDDEEDEPDGSLNPRKMLPLAIATSIDALAVGVSFAFLKVNIIPAATLIGVTTFILSAVGVVIGAKFGAKYKRKAEIAGGVIIIAIGVKILLDHLIS